MATHPKSVIDAAKAIGEALEGLSTEDQQKVIDGVSVLLGLQRPASSASSDRKNGSLANGPSGTNGDVGRGAIDKRRSLVEYMKEKKPATNPQRIAVFAAYREEIEGLENFAKEDLEKYFAKAKLAAPGKNFGRDYNNAVAEGWIHEDGANSYLTQTGLAATSAGFGGKAKPRGKAVAGSSGGKRKPEG